MLWRSSKNFLAVFSCPFAFASPYHPSATQWIRTSPISRNEMEFGRTFWAPWEVFDRPFPRRTIVEFGPPGDFFEVLYVRDGISLLPRRMCYLRAETAGIKTQSDAWKRIADQVKSLLPDPQWLNADLVDNIGVLCPYGHLQRNGLRPCPSYVNTQMARDIFDLWNIARLRRMESDHWEMAPRPNHQHNGGLTLRFFCLWRRQALIAFGAVGCARAFPPFRRRSALLLEKIELVSKLPLMMGLMPVAQQVTPSQSPPFLAPIC